MGSIVFRKIDDWAGRTLFVPPIMKLCQLTRQSQFAVARLFWFIAALDAFYRAETVFWSVIWGGVSLMLMVSAARRANSPTTSFMLLRLLALGMLCLSVLRGIVTGGWAGTEFWIFVLVAEYAGTIRTLPPGKPSKRAAQKKRTAA